MTYTDLAGDPALIGNLPPREISYQDLFRDGRPGIKIKVAESIWYRTHPDYVNYKYQLLEGFPFLDDAPGTTSGDDLQKAILIDHNDYNACFQSQQLLQWNNQARYNVNVYRHIPTVRDSIMTS